MTSSIVQNFRRKRKRKKKRTRTNGRFIYAFFTIPYREREIKCSELRKFGRESRASDSRQQNVSIPTRIISATD